MPLRFLVIAAAIILLAAIAICSLAPSPNMREMAWIPQWLGEWADRNGNFLQLPSSRSRLTHAVYVRRGGLRLPSLRP
jgi:putative exporter of polyketide antibiotics